MIVPTMTLAEVATEIQSDYKEVINRWEKFEPKFNRIRMKKKFLSLVLGNDSHDQT